MTSARLTTAFRLSLLQWGRGLLPGYDGTANYPHRRNGAFNGAGDCAPDMAGRNCCGGARNGFLQWGRGLLPGYDGLCGRLAYPHNTFNGAGDCSPDMT